MELKWLEDFVCLANTGSFSKAAESRKVTQSAFSRRIMALEEWLGAPLINRKTHPITLTDEGHRFVETAQQSVRMFHKVRNDFNCQSKVRRKSLSVGIADHLAIHFFPSWIRGIGNESDKYYFELLSSIRSGVRYFESLRFQEFDFLICYMNKHHSTTFDSGNFASLTLGHESMIPVYKKGLYPSGQDVFPGSVENPVPYISYRPHSSLSLAVSELTTLSDVAPVHLEPVMESSSAESIKSFVLNGFGIGWLPESAVSQEIASGALERAGDERYSVPLSIEIHRHIPNAKPEIIDFWEELESVYKKS